ncbi:MAG: hypothetical protein K9J79_03785 [Desulfobacteraceae bacterium]|nr:hypothetical protein [Desulfobacteraceae bacterium]
MERKKTEYQKIGPQIRKETAQWYEQFFSKVNTGATWALEEMPYLYRRTIAELRGRLDRGELMMILDVMNGAVFTDGFGMSGQYLPIAIQDSFDLYPGQYENKWEVEKKTLMGKLQSLYRFQVACLEMWAGGFWNLPRNKEDAFDVWLAPLLAEDAG